MPDYKVIFAFTQKKQGWSEVYYKTSSSENLDVIHDQVMPLAQKRSNLLGAEATLDAVRVSRVDLANDSVVRFPELNGIVGEPAAQVASALLIRMGNTNNTRHRNMYLRGIYDALEFQGGGYNKLYTPWITRWQNYVGEIELGDYCWFGVDPATKQYADIQGYTADPNNLITFTLKKPLFPVPTIGQTIRVRVSKVNDSSVLNTSLLVTVLTPTTCISTLPFAVFPFRFGGRMLYSVTNRVGVANVRDLKIVKRDTGSPLLASRGRQKARSRG